MVIVNESISLRESEPETSVLYVVGTPIGNLQDISERSKNLLSNVSCILCEDTRNTKKLLNLLNIKNNLISFNEFNSSIKTENIIKKLKNGSSIALVSDAGMPSISDPGQYLVKQARENKIEVICSPGPCAAITGLVSSGFSTESFLFIGFLPKKNIEREKYFKMIANNPFSTIVYESPKRLNLFLKELKNYCGEKRFVHISKELTKKFEKHWTGNLNTIIKNMESIAHKGEFTIVIKGKEINKELDIDKIELKNDLDLLIKHGLKRSSAASYLAHKNKVPKNLIYNLE